MMKPRTPIPCRRWQPIPLKQYLPSPLTVAGRTIDPAAYFITSGCAVQKTLYLLQQLREACLLVHPDRADPWIEAINSVRSLHKYLIAMRGSEVWVECEWRGGELWGCPKSPKRQSCSIG